MSELRGTGALLAMVGNPFFGRLLKGVERSAIERDHLVIVSDSGANPDQELAILDHLSDQRVAGLILSPHGKAPEYAARLNQLAMPFVLVDQKVPGVDSDFVGSGNVLASAMLTEHLIHFGHRRIAHISGRAGLYTTVPNVVGDDKLIYCKRLG